jgi:hypothetical protein
LHQPQNRVDGLFISDFAVLSGKRAKVAELLFDNLDYVSFLVPSDALGAKEVKVATVN